MSGVLALLRPAVLGLCDDDAARAADHARLVLLDLNENPRPLFPDGCALRANRYPEPQPAAVVAAAAALYGAPKDAILVTRGADEGIEVLVRAACEAGSDRILVCPPTYGGYETAAAVQGAGVARAPLAGGPDFRLDLDAVSAALDEPGGRIKLVFLCSPNNPTGTVFPAEAILSVVRAAAGRALVLVDEAYIEYADAASLLTRIPEFPNLVVVRTLSKAWALAGLRCGFLFAAPDLIAVLQRVRAPYPMSGPAVAALEAVFTPEGERRMRGLVAGTLAEKAALRAALSGLPAVQTLYDGEGNFILVRVKDAGRLLAAARKAGVRLRDRSGEEGLAGCVRVTVGTADENRAAVDCFKEASR